MHGLAVHRARGIDDITVSETTYPRSGSNDHLISSVLGSIRADRHTAQRGFNAGHALHPMNASTMSLGQLQLCGNCSFGSDETGSGFVVAAVLFSDVELRKARTHFC